VLADVLIHLSPTPRTPQLTRAEMRCAVAELQGRGLRARDVAQALGVAEAVLRLATEPRPASCVRLAGRR
jgi:hypothetical protein